MLCSCRNLENSNAGWQKVFQNDASGAVVFGDKSKLIEAVRLGYPIRIGWGGMRVEHVAVADFLTIFEGEEVFAQINTIIGQAPAIENDSLKIRFRTEITGLKLPAPMDILWVSCQIISTTPSLVVEMIDIHQQHGMYCTPSTRLL